MLGLSVDFICGNMDEFFDAHLDSSFEHDMRASNVGVRKGEGVPKTEVDVGLRSEVEDGVHVILSEAAEDRLVICHISIDKSEVGAGVEAFGVVQRSAVVNFVKRDDLVLVRICQSEVADDP